MLCATLRGDPDDPGRARHAAAERLRELGNPVVNPRTINELERRCLGLKPANSEAMLAEPALTLIRDERQAERSADIAALSALLPACVRRVLGHGARRLVALEPATGVAPLLPVDHAYLLHYSLNTRRLEFQRAQLPALGLGVSVVTAYDRQHDLAQARECSAIVDPDAAPKLYDLSVGLKLRVALFDAVARGLSRVLVFEDDVEVRWQLLGAAAAAVVNASEGRHWLGGRARRWPSLRVLFLGSYNSNGRDSFCCENGPVAGVVRPQSCPKQACFRPGGVMPAVAQVLSRRGALHVLRHGLPIRWPLDVTLSDSRVPPGNQSGHWVLKPYPFVPAGELQSERIAVRENATTRGALRPTRRLAETRTYQDSGRRRRLCEGSTNDRAVLHTTDDLAGPHPHRLEPRWRIAHVHLPKVAGTALGESLHASGVPACKSGTFALRL